jgi:glycerophosphoryl diester phosphodiesterase
MAARSWSAMVERRFSADAAFPLVVAHRGDSRNEPENTLPAFEAALRAGADAVEFDVRLSADGHAVVMHDAQVSRTTDGDGLVRDLTLRELKSLTVRGPSDATAEVPTLAQALSMLSGRAAIDVEIKNLPGEPDHEPDREAVVEATLRGLDEAAFVGAVLITSFNPRSIGRVRELAPDVVTGFLALEAMPIDDAMSICSASGHAWVLPAVGAVRAAGPAAVARAHAAELRLGTWIVDDPTVAAELAGWGVDAVATNDPRRIVPAVRERTSS